MKRHLELTEARMMFEAEGAALAATQITDEELDQLDAMVLRMERKNRSGGGKERATMISTFDCSRHAQHRGCEHDRDAVGLTFHFS